VWTCSYNTWNDFRCSGITAANVMKVADTMSALKLDTFGYEYINIGACAVRNPGCVRCSWRVRGRNRVCMQL
jgi:hypothetical protein